MENIYFEAEALAPARVLNERRFDGLEIRLLSRNEQLLIAVYDGRSGIERQSEIADDKASHAFRHPMGYLIESNTEAVRQEAQKLFDEEFVDE